MGPMRCVLRRADRQNEMTEEWEPWITLPGAQFEILVDGTPRSYRDTKLTAMGAAHFLRCARRTVGLW